MKTFKTEQRLVNTVTLTEICCDLCGTKAKHSDWGTGYYKINETEIKVTIKQKEGYSYSEGAGGTKYEIDLCPECFKQRLIPWLQSQGAKIKEIDWDY